MYAILLVDDDRDLCALLQRALEAAGYSVRCCLTGHEGVRALAATPCQLVVLDVMLPDMDGFAVVQQIRSRSTVPILMLTAREDSASKVRGLQLGADDYLSKPFEMEELLARVAALIRRYTRLNTADVQHKLVFDGLVIDLDARCVLRNGEPVELLAKEYALLTTCAQHQGQILTKKQIYEAVWQAEYAYDDSNIMATSSRLRKIIEPDPALPTYVQTVKGLGYRFNREVGNADYHMGDDRALPCTGCRAGRCSRKALVSAPQAAVSGCSARRYPAGAYASSRAGPPLRPNGPYLLPLQRAVHPV